MPCDSQRLQYLSEAENISVAMDLQVQRTLWKANKQEIHYSLNAPLDKFKEPTSWIFFLHTDLKAYVKRATPGLEK